MFFTQLSYILFNLLHWKLSIAYKIINQTIADSINIGSDSWVSVIDSTDDTLHCVDSVFMLLFSESLV